MPQPKTPTTWRLRRWFGWSLLGYWCLIFTATHVPISTRGLPRHSDKLAHAAMYAGLSFLLSGWLAVRGKRGLRYYALALAVVVAYGAIDELLQIPAGRHADVNDWLADCAGGLFGLAAMSALSAAVLRKRGEPYGP